MLVSLFKEGESCDGRSTVSFFLRFECPVKYQLRLRRTKQRRIGKYSRIRFVQKVARLEYFMRRLKTFSDVVLNCIYLVRTARRHAGTAIVPEWKPFGAGGAGIETLTILMPFAALRNTGDECFPGRMPSQSGQTVARGLVQLQSRFETEEVRLIAPSMDMPVCA
jgi:hypothetical protein